MMRKPSLPGSLLLAVALLVLTATEPCAAPRTGKAPPRKKLNLTPSYSLLPNGAPFQLDLGLTSPSPAEAAASPPPAEKSWGVLPFVGTDRATTTPPLPERPAIAATDPLTTPPSQLVAGFTYRQGDRLFLNFGYTLPTAPLREYAQPFGVSLTDEEDVKRVTIGIDIAF